MKTKTLSINGKDGKPLNAFVYYPQGDSKGIVHILHGMGEHAERYTEFAEHLVQNDLTVYAHDHRNHGRSADSLESLGMFGKQESFETMVDDVSAVQKHIRTNEPAQPMTILGHSMGSAILRRYLQKVTKAPDKAIIMGTMPQYNGFSGGVLYMLSKISGVFYGKNKRNRFVNRLMNKSMTKKIPNSDNALDWLAHDNAVVSKYSEDPYSGFVYNKVFYNSFFKSLITLNKSSQIKRTALVKTLFISGYEDPLSNQMVAIEKLLKTYRKLIPEFDGDIKAVSNARHEVLNESNRFETYKGLLEWIIKP